MSKHTMIHILGVCWITLVLLIIAFRGEPDIVDAVIFKLYEGHPKKQEFLWERTTGKKGAVYYAENN